MKKLYNIFLIVIALILSASLVSAAVIVDESYDMDHPTFGNDNTAASNPEHDDDDKIVITDTASVTLKNDAAEEVNVSEIVVTPISGFDDDDLNITIQSTLPFAVPASGSADISLEAHIPKDLDAVDKEDGIAQAFKVAAVTFKDESGAEIVSFNVYMQRENQLDLKKIYVNSKDHDDNSFTDGDEVDELRPGESIDIDYLFESNFDDDDDLEIEDIEVFYDIDDGDIDEKDDTSSDDLSPGDESDDDMPRLNLDIDSDADAGTSTGHVWIIGQDENGAWHGERWEVDFKIERKTHELVFDYVDISKSTLSCNDRTTTIELKVENLGRKDEKETAVYLSNSDLGIDWKKEDFRIDSGDTWKKDITITIPEDTEPGSYDLRVTVYYSGDEDDGVQSDLKDLTLTVTSCSTAQEEEEEEEEIVEEFEVNQPPQSGNELNIPPAIAEELGLIETTETSFLDTRAFDVILVAAVVIAFGMLIFLLGKLLML